MANWNALLTGLKKHCHNYFFRLQSFRNITFLNNDAIFASPDFTVRQWHFGSAAGSTADQPGEKTAYRPVIADSQVVAALIASIIDIVAADIIGTAGWTFLRRF